MHGRGRRGGGDEHGGPSRHGGDGQFGARRRHRPGRPAAPGRRHPDGLQGSDRRHRRRDAAQVAAVSAELQSQVPAGPGRGAPAGRHRSGVRAGHPAGQRVHRLPGRRRAVRHRRPGRGGRRSPNRSPRPAAPEMRAVGINVDFAPDADVLPASGDSGVADRTFGSDPERSARLVAAAVRGYQSGGVAATVKHFPGIGRVATDTHKALPTLDASCDGVECGRGGAVARRGGRGHRAGDDRAHRAAGGRRGRAIVRADSARWSPTCSRAAAWPAAPG